MASRPRKPPKKGKTATGGNDEKRRPDSLTVQRTATVIVGRREEQQQFEMDAEGLSKSTIQQREKIEVQHNLGERKPLILENATLQTVIKPNERLFGQKVSAGDIEVEKPKDDEENGSNVKEHQGNLEARSVHQNRTDCNVPTASNARDQSVTNRRLTSEPNNESTPWDAGLTRKDRVFGRMRDIWIFASSYGIYNFQRAAILGLQQATKKWDSVPCPTVVNRALDSLDLDAALSRFLVRSYAYLKDHQQISKQHLATLPPEFLVAVLEVMFQRLDGELGDRDENWCDFHEHNNDSDREACENGRLNDPDASKKRLAPSYWDRYPKHRNIVQL